MSFLKILFMIDKKFSDFFVMLPIKTTDEVLLKIDLTSSSWSSSSTIFESPFNGGKVERKIRIKIEIFFMWTVHSEIRRTNDHSLFFCLPSQHVFQIITKQVANNSRTLSHTFSNSFQLKKTSLVQLFLQFGDNFVFRSFSKVWWNFNF